MGSRQEEDGGEWVTFHQYYFVNSQRGRLRRLTWATMQREHATLDSLLTLLSLSRSSSSIAGDSIAGDTERVHDKYAISS